MAGSVGLPGFFREYVQDVGRNFKFRYLGLGFLWAWIYATWLTPIVFVDAKGLAAQSSISWAVSALTVAIALFAMAFFLRDREISTFRWIVYLAGPLTTVGSLLSASQSLFGVGSGALGALGGIVSGVASSWLWMLWGEFSGKVEQETAELFVPLCVLVPMAVLFTCAFVSGPVAGFAVCLLPTVSGAMLILCEDDEAIKPVTLPPQEERPQFKSEFSSIGVGSVIIYVCVSFIWGMLDCTVMTGWGDTYLLPFVVGAALAYLISVFAISFSVKLDLFGLYRWLVPVILFSLVFLVVDTFWGQSISFFLVTVGHFGFDVIIWLYFCRAVRAGACSGSFAIGINRGFVQIGVFLGTVLADAVSSALSSSAQSLMFVVLVLCALLGSISLWVLDRKDASVASQPVEPAVPSIDDKCDDLAAEHSLTPREREVLGYLAHGRSLPYIRDELVLSKNTVSTHVKNIYKKLDVHSRQELFDLLEK